MWELPSMGRARALALMCGAFLAGAGLGCLWAMVMRDSSPAALRRYVEGCLASTRVGGSILSGLWRSLRMPLAVVLLRFATLGTVLIPPLMGVKGFLLTFSVASFVRSYGAAGEWASLAVFGPFSMLEVGVTLFLAVESWLGACESLRDARGGIRDGGRFLRSAAVCALLLAGGALLRLATEEAAFSFLGWILGAGG